jgi:hypothetical protein
MGKWIRLFNKSNSSGKTLLELERKVAALEHQLQGKILIDQGILTSLLEKVNSTVTETPPVVHVEHLQVDKIIIEKLDYANNFGQLGIKELTGKLNIGTNYEGAFTKQISKKLNEKLGKQAKLNFRAKKET